MTHTPLTCHIITIYFKTNPTLVWKFYEIKYFFSFSELTDIADVRLKVQKTPDYP